jgi:hypothetical protein
MLILVEVVSEKKEHVLYMMEIRKFGVTGDYVVG